MSYPHNPAGAPQPNQGMSTGAKVGLFGCGIPAALLVLLIGCGAVLTAGGEDAVEDTTTEASDGDETGAQEEARDEPAEEEGPDTYSDGIHQVGEDIEPGTYTTDGPDENDLMPNCYYARLAGLGGELDDIIANNNFEGPSTVEVAESDAALELSGGCEWELMD